MSFMFGKGSFTKEEEKRKKEIKKMFIKADRDGDGKLSKEEWFRVLNSTGYQTSMEEVEKFFLEMDRDFDGKLSFEEFMGEETSLERLFKSMDKNGDGSVTKEEFISVCKNLSPQQVEEAFKKFDNNGDQRLDYKEFCLMIHGRATPSQKK